MKKFLYKYLPSTGDELVERLESYLNQEVWLTPLNQFNDPFEGKFHYSSIYPETVLSNPELFNQLLEEHHKNGELDLNAEEFKKRLESPEFREALENNNPGVNAINIFESHGAICLTLRPDNIPMWAYYGNNHKGCCLEFEVDFSVVQKNTGISQENIDRFSQDISDLKTLLSFNLSDTPYHFIFLRINYENNLPSIDLDKLASLKTEYLRLQYIIRKTVGVKFIQWAHEDEIRLIVNANSRECGLLPLSRFVPFLKVTGIIIGSAMTEEDKQAVKVLSKKYGARLMTSFCSRSDYQIDIKEYEYD